MQATCKITNRKKLFQKLEKLVDEKHEHVDDDMKNGNSANKSKE
jgi:hypothetical protein